jgi:hypothetical protein
MKTDTNDHAHGKNPVSHASHGAPCTKVLCSSHFTVSHKINYAHVRAENPLLRPRITCPSRNSTQTCAPSLIFLHCHAKSITFTYVQKTYFFDLVSPAPHVTARKHVPRPSYICCATQNYLLSRTCRKRTPSTSYHPPLT